MKKLLLLSVIALALTLLFATAVFADVVHDESNVDYDEKVTLSDGKVLPLFDENKEALVWYISGTDENGDRIYKSILAQDNQMKWYTESWGEVTGAGINFDDGTKVEGKNIVVVNMMDDDIVKNHGPGADHEDRHITGFKYLFRGWKNLEYVYLRLDVGGIFKESFNGCSSLQYINLEDLTNLKRIGDNYNFAGCTSLFKGQVLDLSKTKLTSIDWCDSFSDVPIVGIKLPATITNISGGTFKETALVSYAHPEGLSVLNASMFENCTDLTTVYLSSKKLNGIINKDSDAYTIGNKAFLNCTSLTTVFFVGTFDELNALLDKTNPSGNDSFLAVAGENRENLISYADYQKLEDKSGKYMVYDYSWCEAYNEGMHITTPVNNCVGDCSVCNNLIVVHNEEQNISVSIAYTSYTQKGKKITACLNDGCTYKISEEVPSIFICQGYSAPENGSGGIVLGFLTNKDALAEFVRVNGKELRYGVFAVSQKNLMDNTVFNENGEASQGVINADLTNSSFVAFELKIRGFETDEQRNAKLALGAYVLIDGEYSYIQVGTPKENDKYVFTSFNEILAQAN